MWIKIQELMQCALLKIADKTVFITAIFAVCFLVYFICNHMEKIGIEIGIEKDKIKEKVDCWSEHLYMGHH